MTITLTLVDLLAWSLLVGLAFFGSGVIFEYCAAAIAHDRRHHPKGHR